MNTYNTRDLGGYFEILRMSRIKKMEMTRVKSVVRGVGAHDFRMVRAGSFKFHRVVNYTNRTKIIIITSTPPSPDPGTSECRNTLARFRHDYSPVGKCSRSPTAYIISVNGK